MGAADALIQAFVRMRPASKSPPSAQAGKDEAWKKVGARGITQCLDQKGKDVTSPAMFFDRVFGPEEKNGAVFRELVPLLDAALNGDNICVLAYGQTASGKTHTMKGSLSQIQKDQTVRAADPGLVPKSISYLFSELQKIFSSFCVASSFVEVYNEQVFDLLGNPLMPLQVRERSPGEVWIAGAKESPVNSAEDALRAFREGDANRKIGATAMNRQSSRSHALFTLRIKTRGMPKMETAVSNQNPGIRVICTFVDLAGSERVKQSEAARAKEGACINKSLLALTSVIAKLSAGSPHVPFRDAKLTRILQPVLSGRARTLIICTVSPECRWIEETLATLNLANRAKNIKVATVFSSSGQQKKHFPPVLRLQATHSPGPALSSGLAVDLAAGLERARRDLAAARRIEAEIRKELEKPASQDKKWRNPDLSPWRNALSSFQALSSSVSSSVLALHQRIDYLIRKEQALSKRIEAAELRGPPEYAVLITHLVEGDRLIQEQQRKIRALEKENRGKKGVAAEDPQNPLPSAASIILAVEVDKLKKEHKREKRILQLQIARLNAQLENQGRK